MSDLDESLEAQTVFGKRRKADGGRAQTAVARGDVSDADFEIVVPDVGPAERIVADAPVKSAQAAAEPGAASGMGMLQRTPRFAAGHAPRKAGPVFWAGGAVAAAAAFWISGGHALLRPALAEIAPHAEQGLRIASVISKVDRSGIRPVLQIDGRAVNDGTATTMPPLDIQVTSPGGTTTLYKLGTAGSRIASGDSFDFSSRLDVPKDGVKTVFVTFAE